MVQRLVGHHDIVMLRTLPLVDVALHEPESVCEATRGHQITATPEHVRVDVQAIEPEGMNACAHQRSCNTDFEVAVASAQAENRRASEPQAANFLCEEVNGVAEP